MDMTINRLPSLTWNWLRLNDSKADDVKIQDRAALVSEEAPEGVRAERLAAMPDTEAKTALGEDMDRLIAGSGTEVLGYTADQSVSDDTPARLDILYEENAENVNAFWLETADGGNMTVIQNFRSDRKTHGEAAVQTRYRVGKGSRLTLVQVLTLGDAFRFFNDLGGVVEENGDFELVQIVLSGNRIYTGNYSLLEGMSANLRADSGYIVQNDDLLDMNYVAYHKGTHTTCEMNAYGVLRDQAKKIYRGTIDLRCGAKGAVGNEQESILLMDDDVVNQTIPVILCDEEDVEGNHGATIGKLDDETLFYLETRGMRQEDIYEMMAIAKIETVLHRVCDEKTRQYIEAYIGDEEEAE